MKNKKKRGFSLTELMVSMSLGSLFLTAAVSSIFQTSTSVLESNTRVFENSQARLTIDKFYLEARSISEIHVTTSSIFEFSYLDYSGTKRKVRYEWDNLNGTLKKTDNSTSSVKTINMDLSDVKFDYFDKSGNEVTSPSLSNINVNAVQVSFKQYSENKEFVVESPIIMFRNKTLI